MAEGGRFGPDPSRRGEEINKTLEQYGKAVMKLKEIGLAHKAAVIQAGEMFDIRLNPDDVSDEPPTPVQPHVRSVG